MNKLNFFKKKKALSGDNKSIQTNESLNYLESDFTDIENLIYNEVKPFTMTSKERVVSLIRSVEYIIQNNIEGDFVECGVWKGGSSMAIIKTLQHLGEKSRNIYLYDTYEGMPEADDKVDLSYNDVLANSLLKNEEDNKDKSVVWAYSTLEEVKTNINSLGYDKNNIHFIKGKVEETLIGNKHNCISLLRLDTDWYSSTKIEMEELFPKLSTCGILIVDDYGHWKGAKKAIDEYIEKNKIKLFLSRIDYTGRLAVKIQ